MTYLGKRKPKHGEAWSPEPTCPMCGKRGSHFVGPSLGELGVYVCKKIKPLDRSPVEKKP